MANTKSAQKTARQTEVKRERNLARRTSLKTAIKKVLVALDKQEDMTKVKELLQDAESKIARACGKGLIHKNNASRKISRLTKRVAGTAQK
jgi:small subunit ribosomal protein S20